MRAVGLHADVVVATSRAYQTTCTLVRSGGEAFCIDSPIFPDELEIVPALAEQAGFTVVGLLATHGDWDHVLGRYAFPEAPLGCAETTAARLVGEPGAAQRPCASSTRSSTSSGRGRCRCRARSGFRCRASSRSATASSSCSRRRATPRTGWRSGCPWARVLVVGDYLSPIEIPWLHGSANAYIATLNRLEPLVEEAEHVVPGHGAPMDGTRAAAILREDRAYLEALLADGEKAKLPIARNNGGQRKIHAENVAHVSS